jgi:hypothetical protein
MSQSTSKFIQLADKRGSIFTGGIIDNSESWMIPYKNTPYARNFRVSWRGISVRLGFNQFGSSFAGVDYPRWIAAYYRSALANDRIIVRYNSDSTHKLVSVLPTTGAQTDIATAALITSDNRMNFVNANDSLYCMNWIDLIGKLNGTTYSNPTATLKPSFGAWFNESLWISWDPAKPTTLYKSVTGNPESFSGTDSDELTQSTPIVGLCSNMQTLYIFTEWSIDLINTSSIKTAPGTNTLIYTSVPLETMEGAMSHNTIANVGKNVYFLTKSGKIKMVTPGQLTYDVSELSHRANRGITKTMDTLDSDQSAGFCYVVPELQLVKWHLKTKGSNFNDICIVYNTEYDEFMVDDHKVFYGGVNYKTQNFTISQIEPKIYKDEYGYTDDDSPIQFRYDTKILDLWEPTINKCLWQMRTYLALSPITKIYQNIYADGALIDSKLIDSTTIPAVIDGIGTEPVGTFAMGTEGFTNDDIYNTTIVRDKGYLRVRAKNFQVSYVSYELGSRLLLQKLMPQAEMLHFLTTNHY